MRVGVVGHVEWIRFLRVDHLPQPGEIVHAVESWEEPAGGGAAAAEQLRKLAGEATFFTALGTDELGRRTHDELTRKGLRLEVAWRDEPTRTGVTHVDATGERTITVVGNRLAPGISDPLPWDGLGDYDAVYFTAGDLGALAAARRARVLVATSRVFDLLDRSDVELDVLVGSAADPTEHRDVGLLPTAPRAVVWTEGERGGTYARRGDEPKRYETIPFAGVVSDRYGAGDAFAAGLTFGLAASGEMGPSLEVAARCGAAVLAGRGPYETQLTGASLGSLA
jgi:ribokinase